MGSYHHSWERGACSVRSGRLQMGLRLRMSACRIAADSATARSSFAAMGWTADGRGSSQAIGALVAGSKGGMTVTLLGWTE